MPGRSCVAFVLLIISRSNVVSEISPGALRQPIRPAKSLEGRRKLIPARVHIINAPIPRGQSFPRNFWQLRERRQNVMFKNGAARHVFANEFAQKTNVVLRSETSLGNVHYAVIRQVKKEEPRRFSSTLKQ